MVAAGYQEKHRLPGEAHTAPMVGGHMELNIPHLLNVCENFFVGRDYA